MIISSVRSPGAALLLLLLCLACSGPAKVETGALEADRPVDATNLYEREAYWPHNVALTRPMRSPQLDEEIPADLPGVLIRVEPEGRVRIDFARFGQVEVPLGATTAIARAESIRLGQTEKFGPNLLVLLLNSLADPAREDGTPTLHYGSDPADYLLLFVDPRNADSFERVIAALAPLRDVHGLTPILVPQDGFTLSNRAVADQLKALDWPMLFVQTPFAEAHTVSFLDAGTPRPWFMLTTPQGRVLDEGSLRPDDFERDRPQLEASFVHARADELARAEGETRSD